MKPLNPLYARAERSIFEQANLLARRTGALNLGQGAPDRQGPPEIIETARQALLAGSNQYAPLMGTDALRAAVAGHDRRFYGLDVEPENVLITGGATEALAAAIFALVEPGDPVLLLEPLYDNYLPLVRQAGGRPRLIRLEPPDWRLPLDELADAFAEGVKLIILNSPMNPCAKVFDADELSALAGMIERADAYALCDEVYEHLLFDGRRHKPLMSLPGMAERALRAGSAGKTFSFTGWKVGYLVAAPVLIEAAARVHQNLLFTVPGHLQDAVAAGLSFDDAFFNDLAATFQSARDRLAAGLARLGFTVMPAAGGYFLLADIRPVAGGEGDRAFGERMALQAGVSAIPAGAFYAGDAPPGHMLRFCFARRDAVIDQALARLEGFLAASRTAHA